MWHLHDNGGCPHGMDLICVLWCCFWFVFHVCGEYIQSLWCVYCMCCVSHVCVSGVCGVFVQCGLCRMYCYFFQCLFFRERERAQAGEEQRERETQNPKQAPGSELSTQSPMRGSK